MGCKNDIKPLDSDIGSQKTAVRRLQTSEGKLFLTWNSIFSQTINQVREQNKGVFRHACSQKHFLSCVTFPRKSNKQGEKQEREDARSREQDTQNRRDTRGSDDEGEGAPSKAVGQAGEQPVQAGAGEVSRGGQKSTNRFDYTENCP